MNKKRLLAIFVILTMLSTLCLPFYVTANPEGETMMYIETPDDLIDFARRVNNGETDLDASLMCDITLDDTFIPVGENNDFAYNGEFNGNNHEITLNMTTPLNYAGVFGVIDVNGEILNLKVSGVVKGITAAGGITAYSYGKIYNCSNTASVYSETNDAGGIAGSTLNSSVTERCSNSGEVSANKKYAGGIIGRSRGLVTDCYSTGVISGPSNVGGIVGAAPSGSIKNSFSYLNNGVFGYKSTSTVVSNCYYLVGGADGMGASQAKFASGYIAHYLNTNILTEPNRSVWAQGEKHPVFATESNKPLYQITFILASQKVKVYTNTNGTVTFPNQFGTDIKWFKDGELVTNETVFNSDCTLEGIIPDSSSDAVSAIIPSAENNIPYDIKPMYKDNCLYFFLPSVADLENVTYILSDDEGNVVDTITADFTTGEIHTVNFSYGEYKIKAFKSSIPALFLNIDETHGTIDKMNSSPDHSVSCYGDLKLVVPDDLKEKYGWEDVVSKEDDEETPGSINMKGRGNSSWSPELGIKKAYQVKFEKKTSLLGMDKSKKWCLLRDNSDLYKNGLAFELARKMNMEYACESQYSDVYMNGEYLGTYLITDKIEIGGASVDITDLDDAFEENGDSVDGLDLTGGYLLEIDNTTDDLQFIASGNKITIKGPEDLAKTASTDGPYGYIINHTKDLFSAIYSDGYLSDGSHFMEHIDIESFAKYFWHQELLGNKDCGSGSTYLYKDSDSVDSKFHAGPIWDNDLSLMQAEGWILPNLKRGNVSTGTPILYNALCQHKEFVSYLLFYYKSSLDDYLVKAPEMLSSIIPYIETSENMNALRWGKDNKKAAQKDTDILTKRLKWISNNYFDITSFGTKGEFVKFNEYQINSYAPHGGEVTQSTDVSVTGGNVTLKATAYDEYEFKRWVVEKGNITLPAEPEVTFNMPEEDVIIKAVFDDKVEREVIASYNFSRINGSKNGYTPNNGEAKLTVSADGINKSDLRLNTDDFDGSVAVFSGTENIPYGTECYIDIEFDSRKYENIAFSADIGGKNAAPLSWRIMYSTDGINYTELENSEYTLLKAFNIKESYYHVKVPVSGVKNAHIRLVTSSTVTVDGGSFEGATHGEAAIDNIEILGIDTGIEVEEDPIIVTGTATKYQDRIVLQLNTDQNLTNEVLHYAMFNSEGKYVDYGYVPILKPNDEFYVVLDAPADAEYAKIFIWDNMIDLNALSPTVKINITE